LGRKKQQLEVKTKSIKGVATLIATTMSKTDTVLLQQISKEIQNLTNRVNDISDELDKDRHNIQDLNVNIHSLREEINQVRKAVNMTSEKVKNKVADVVEPIVECADRMTTEIHDKKIIGLKDDKRSLIEKIVGTR
jgi:methyl-accepting chemotaxis protein